MNSGYEERPAIPAEIKRRVLVEAGHRCAIPTCRYINVEIHHIVPWSTCKTHDYENLIALCPNCHSRADRNEIDRKSLRLYKFNLRFAHDKFSQLEMDMMFELYKAPADYSAPWGGVQFLIFFKRAIDAGFLEILRPPGGSIRFNGINQTPTLLHLTQKGRAFIDELGLNETE